MTDTEKRIEIVKLLQALRQNDEKPGDIILRALRHANEEREKMSDDDVREVQLPFTRSQLLSTKFAIEQSIDFHQSELDELKDIQQQIEEAIAALDGKQ